MSENIILAIIACIASCLTAWIAGDRAGVKAGKTAGQVTAEILAVKIDGLKENMVSCKKSCSESRNTINERLLHVEQRS